MGSTLGSESLRDLPERFDFFFCRNPAAFCLFRPHSLETLFFRSGIPFDSSFFAFRIFDRDPISPLSGVPLLDAFASEVLSGQSLINFNHARVFYSRGDVTIALALCNLKIDKQMY